MKGKYGESEGEELIRLYLEEQEIKFEQEKEIKGIQGDFATSRVADFYLPTYKVYVEFFGQWNSSEMHKERYRAKKKLYFDNHIPCIYLYPENLGILDFIFKRRLKVELSKHPELKWKLVKLNLNLFLDNFGILGILFVSLIFYTSNLLWRAGFLLLSLSQIYNSLKKSFLRK